MIFSSDNVLTEKLNLKLIDDWSEAVAEFCQSSGLGKDNVIRYRLMTEECLLHWLENFGEGTEVILKYGRKFTNRFLILECKGNSFNPFSFQQTSQGFYINSILKNLGSAPEYSYDGKYNIISLKVKGNHKSAFLPLIISVISAILISSVGMMVSWEAREFLLTTLLTPIHDTFLNILGCLAGPMIFLSVSWGIYGIGDTSTLSKIGWKLMLSFLSVSFIYAALSEFVCFPFFDIPFTLDNNLGNEAKSIVEMILGIFPSNIISPFIDGNSLQIILMAVVVGIAMLFLGKQTYAVAVAIEQINYIIQMLMELISKIVPYFIFVILVRLVWLNSMGVVLSVWKMSILFLVCELLAAVCLITYTGIKHKTNPLNIVKKAIPAFIIAITTASSSAAFGTTMSTAINKYGVKNSFASFGVPLGTVLFKPNMAIFNILAVLYFAEYYKISCSPVWIITSILITGILAIAIPPIPGGALTAYTILFLQMGIPEEALAVMLTIDAFFDFIITGFDVFSMPLVLSNNAQRFGMINENVMKKKEE